MAIVSKNPATGEELERFEAARPDEVDAVLGAVSRAFRAWRDTTFADRAVLMERAADHLRDHRDEYGRLVALEMGKTLVESRAEIEKCAWCCDWYAEHAERLLADETIASSA